MPDDVRNLKQTSSLWIHGAGLAGQTWRHMTRDLPLAKTPDLPGHGRSTNNTSPRVKAYAEALMPMLSDSMVLIGHSLGGMVALELAARGRARLSALILIEAVPTVTDRWIGRIGPRLARPFLAHLPKSLLERLSSAGQSPEAAAETRHWLSKMPQERIVDAFDAARFYDGRRHLASLRLPTLVVVGKANTATHRGARLFANSIRGAEFVTLEGGHMLHVDNPEGLRRAIEAFLAKNQITNCDRKSGNE